MQRCDALFRGKRITVMGLGLLGRGVGDAEFLAQCGAQVLITDRKQEAELAESVARLKQYPNVVFRLGEHREEDFVRADMVVKAAGVPLNSPYIAAAKAAGVPVYMSTALFAKHAADAGVALIGVTGTRGKSTVAHMVFRVLQRAGRKALLGGNIRGTSTLALLPMVEEGDIAVLELDSWQLQGFGDLQISPHVAVFTNFMPDHQNYYRSMDEYFADKANIFKYQKVGDVLIAGASVAERIRAAAPPLDPVVPERLPYTWKLRVLGEHNRENASLAAAALAALGLSEEEIREGLESFEPIEGRLQFVREVRGVKIYNDNNATTPEATIAALRALKRECVVENKESGIILIMGGADKGLQMNDLLDEMRTSCKAVVLLPGTGTEKLISSIQSPIPIFNVTDIKDALEKSMDVAQEGDIILFSPAFASFGQPPGGFKNEYDRNDAFLKAVAAL